LLQKDPKKRLGAERGIAELKEHAFMADVNWATLIKDPAPWVPGGRDADDSNFPNAKEDDLTKILAEETKEDFAAVQQASMTMKFNGAPLVQLPAAAAVAGKAKADIELVHIQGTAFDAFEGVSYRALEAINQKEATNEMRRVDNMLKKMKQRGQQILKKNRFTDQSEQLISQTMRAVP